MGGIEEREVRVEFLFLRQRHAQKVSLRGSSAASDVYKGKGKSCCWIGVVLVFIVFVSVGGGGPCRLAVLLSCLF